jgi:hypothetical protein
LKKKIADNIYSSVDVDDELKDTKQAQAVFSTLAMYTQQREYIVGFQGLLFFLRLVSGREKPSGPLLGLIVMSH